MIKPNQKLIMVWNGRNKSHYIKKGYEFTNIGDSFLVDVSDLTRTSKVKVSVVCDICDKNEYKTSNYNATKSKQHICIKCKENRNKIKVNCYACNKEFISTKTALNKSKSGNLFCSNECVGEYNKIIKNKQVIKNCLICGEEYSIKPSLAKTSITCSIFCQNKWQSKYLVGKNANNYKGGNRIKDCLYCSEPFDSGTPSEYQSRKFCSIECKQEHWTQNTLTSDTFIKNRYEGNLKYREEYSIELETKPEAITRRYLESIGLVKDVDFYQERGFMRKYFADFYIPKNKIVIEVMGDYWHGNPKIYGDEEGKIPLNESQLDRIKKDKIKKQDFLRNGYTYIEIWESDIYEDINRLMEEKLLKIYPLNDYTQDTQTVKVGG